MSQVKFEKESVRATTGGGKEDFIHNIGEALTKSSGTDGYLAVSIHIPCNCSALCRVNDAEITQEARS
jgi:hypothetical protein